MKRNSGFTMVEAIIVVSVLALLVSISLPPITGYIAQQRVVQEEGMLLEIQNALESMARDTAVLPSDDASCTCSAGCAWAAEVAAYTNLSEDQICEDTWGNKRFYTTYQASETFLGSNIPIYFAAIFSKGSDQTAENATGIAVDSGEFKAEDDSDWWSHSSGTERADYQQLKPGGDDLMIKVSDYKIKIEKYEATLERLKALAAALDTYSRVQYLSAISASEAGAETKIFVPPSEVPSSAADSATYGDALIGPSRDMATYFGNSTAVVENNAQSGTEQARREDMIKLMRLLGLPDSYCCDAMQQVDIGGGVNEEKGFYYYSNPRPITGPGTCGTRYSDGSSPPVTPLPPRISTAPYDCP